MASLPKPRSQPSRPDGANVWPASGIHPLPENKAEVSSNSSLLGLGEQNHAPGDSSSAASIASGFAKWVRDIVRWWMTADFRYIQVPILVLALGAWAMTIRWAWQSQESATPLLRESIASIRQQQAQASIGNVSIAPITNIHIVPAAPITSSPKPVVSRMPHNQGSGLAYWMVSSFRSLLLPEPTPAEPVEGNPRRKVWVDLKTGLYYCPGADYYGYGGADRGKVMSQKDAQYEYFQPAAGAPCD